MMRDALTALDHRRRHGRRTPLASHLISLLARHLNMQSRPQLVCVCVSRVGPTQLVRTSAPTNVTTARRAVARRAVLSDNIITRCMETRALRASLHQLLSARRL